MNPANTSSEKFFRSLGIEHGMRVLDIGCGNGDLSRLLAHSVGSSGEVVAIDQADGVLNQARAMSDEMGSSSIRFERRDLNGEISGLGHFDAIVGRRVLMYVADATRTLANLAELSRSGTIWAFQEHARANLPAGAQHLPEHARLYDWVWDTVSAEGGDTTLAFRLPSILLNQGLHDVSQASESVLLLEGQPSFLPILAKHMLSRFIENGIADADTVDLKTIADRLHAEHVASSGSIVWDLAFFVKARSGPIRI